MLRDDRARRGTWPTSLGIALLIAATSTALFVARWGDSALVLILAPAAVAGYLAGRRMSALAPAVATFAGVLILTLPLSFAVPGGAPLGDWMASVVIALLAVVSPWWLGRYRLLRAEQREADAALLAERAQAEERARIADDLHDTIGHELALIAVQAGALELDRDLRPAQQERFRDLREAAVRASGRLRDVVQMTRPDGAGRLEPLGSTGIEAIVEGARDAGMSVRAESDPSLISAAHPLIAELAVRTVREGLTNAARHAPGSPVDVDVEGDDVGRITVRVRSAASGASSTGAGGGHGIPSLRRRAELLGATVHAGATGDGFELRLTAPLRPHPPESDATDLGLRTNAHAARRRLLQSAMLPVVIVVLALAGFVAVQAITVTQTAISSEVYAGIALGSTREELAPLLPGGTPGPVPITTEPPVPEGADCDYFAARDGWLHFTDASYRLCFRDDVLVEKTLLGAS
jgi:signal transduction histidine kinase